MKDQIITFKTAKLAKEKGFNLHITKAFDLKGNESKYSYKPGTNLCKHQLPKPTQSLLQKWLWETFNIFISIIPIKSRDCLIVRFQFRIIDFRKDLEEVKYEHQYNSDWEVFDNPYLANEKGLQKALKLI